MTRTFILHGERYRISREDVLMIARTAKPERITGYYVDIKGRRFPPTQLVRLAARTRTRPHPVNSRSILASLLIGFTSYPAGQSPPPSGPMTPGDVTSDDLARWRRSILRVLDRLDGRPERLGPAARIGRLTDDKRLARTIAAHMRVILEHRNAAEYESAEATETQGQAVWGSWNAVLEWAKAQGIEA